MLKLLDIILDININFGKLVEIERKLSQICYVPYVHINNLLINTYHKYNYGYRLVWFIIKINLYHISWLSFRSASY